MMEAFMAGSFMAGSLSAVCKLTVARIRIRTLSRATFGTLFAAFSGDDGTEKSHEPAEDLPLPAHC
jgi:hypothetical protein